MNDQQSPTSIGVRKWLAVLMTLAAAGSVLLIVNLLRASEPAYVLQFDGSYIPPAYMLALIAVFCVLFGVKVLMKKRVNTFAVTIASLFSLILVLAAMITMQNYLLMSILFFDPPATPTLSILALVGIIALIWPRKISRS